MKTFENGHKIVRLHRKYLPDRTEGIIYLNGKVVKTIEPPWLNNKRFKSCIPEDRYLVKRRWSPRFKWHYHIKKVKGRTWILFHPGITVKNSTGCTLTGFNRILGNLARGREALNFMLGFLGKEFILIIRNSEIEKKD